MAKVAAVYDFRCNADMYTMETLRATCQVLGKKYTFQKECGESGYVHWQGRISLFKKKRQADARKLWEATGSPVPNWIKPAVEGTIMGDAFYCMKLDTRVEGPFSDKDRVLWTSQAWAKPDEWHGWQQEVIETREVRNKRTINLVIDPSGNHGKTHLSMYLEQHELATVVPTLQDCKEIMECVCDELMGREERDPRLVIVDLPRALSKKQMSGLFAAIENIKNGKVIDRRYHFKKWFFEPPQVWVFTNRLPNMAYMSRDRWNIWGIDDESYELYPMDIPDGNDDEIDDETPGGGLSVGA